jgi:hypothetical protein
MSFSIFLGLCILGLDFLIYVLFKWTFGDKRRAIARQVAAHRNAPEAQPTRPSLVNSPERLGERQRAATAGTEKLFPRNSYTTRTA